MSDLGAAREARLEADIRELEQFVQLAEKAGGLMVALGARKKIIELRRDLEVTREAREIEAIADPLQKIEAQLAAASRAKSHQAVAAMQRTYAKLVVEVEAARAETTRAALEHLTTEDELVEYLLGEFDRLPAGTRRAIVDRLLERLGE